MLDADPYSPKPISHGIHSISHGINPLHVMSCLPCGQDFSRFLDFVYCNFDWDGFVSGWIYFWGEGVEERIIVRNNNL